MTRAIACDLCVIGGGSAGLSVAAGAAQLGLSVVLFERGAMGGDCLNAGCVPSKALIAAAAAAQATRDATRFGVHAEAPRIDWSAVKAHVAGVIAEIAPIDSQERFEGLGVTVIREHARFVDGRTIASASTRVRARRVVIATGSVAAAPAIPGLDTVSFLTNETIFDVEDFPRRLLILGAGPIGVELGQAFRRLGAEVTLLEAATALPRMDEDAARIVLARLTHEGVTVRERCTATQIARDSEGVVVTVTDGGGAVSQVRGSHLLLATGRRPVIDGLDLDKAGVAFTDRGVTTDAFLRTTNPRVWALGDVAGREAFTHAAGWHASAWVRSVLFKARTRADAFAIPAVTYCDPEIAQIGLTEAQARAHYGDAAVQTARWDFTHNDRAVAERDTEGFCKLVIDKGGRILGCVVVGAHAGDVLAPVTLAMAAKLKVRALTSPVIAYPTRSEIWKRAAGAFYTPILFSPRTRALVGLLKHLP
ncbi:MAG: FAD-dependent oxidoreductase [Hyphomonadaceae bacterium]|nr:FAD-dependent oxidoreductase [Hyphomonadaceae bacterium]